MVPSVVFQFFTIALAFLSLTAAVTSRGFYSVQFLKYSNPDGLEDDGEYCDGSSLWWRCEFYFKITFRNDKVRKSFTSKVFEEEDQESFNVISFGSKISNKEPNPFKMDFFTFQGHLRYTIEVWDEDDYYDDRIEVLSGKIKLSVGEKWKIIKETRKESAPSFLRFQVKAECYSFYYGNSCSTYCPLGYDKKKRRCNSDGVSTSSTRSTDSPLHKTTASTVKDQKGSTSQLQISTFPAHLEATSTSNHMAKEQANSTQPQTANNTEGPEAYTTFTHMTEEQGNLTQSQNANNMEGSEAYPIFTRIPRVVAAAVVTVACIAVIAIIVILYRRRRKEAPQAAVEVVQHGGHLDNASSGPGSSEADARKGRDEEVICSEIVVQHPHARPDGQGDDLAEASTKEEKPEEII